MGASDASMPVRAGRAGVRAGVHSSCVALVLSLPSGLKQITVFTSDGSAEVMLLGVPGGGGTGTFQIDTFSPTDGQTLFTLSQVPSAPTTALVYLNGQEIGADQYTIVGTAFTWLNLLFPLDAGDNVTVYYAAPATGASAGTTSQIRAAQIKQWASPARANKSMAASTTVVDGDLACATAVAVDPSASTPAGGYIRVTINNVGVLVGDGTKVAVPCYFSSNGGVTALPLRSVFSGALLYWNQSVAGFQLDPSDSIDFNYQTVQ